MDSFLLWVMAYRFGCQWADCALTALWTAVTILSFSYTTCQSVLDKQGTNQRREVSAPKDLYCPWWQVGNNPVWWAEMSIGSNALGLDVGLIGMHYSWHVQDVGATEWLLRCLTHMLAEKGVILIVLELGVLYQVVVRLGLGVGSTKEIPALLLHTASLKILRVPRNLEINLE